MRDALNASGRPIVFSLCGWNPWYAPTGAALGNMWRIGPDGGDWGSVLTDIDFDAPLWPYAGPGAWNDPDELGGCTWCGSPLNALQRRAQFSVYAALAAPLLLSIDLPNISAFDRATYLNAEAIAISQDPLGKQAVRVAGGDLLRSSERLRQRRARWGRGEFVGDSDDAPGVALQPCTPNASDARGLPILEQQWALTAPQRQLRARELRADRRLLVRRSHVHAEPRWLVSERLWPVGLHALPGKCVYFSAPCCFPITRREKHVQVQSWRIECPRDHPVGRSARARSAVTSVRQLQTGSSSSSSSSSTSSTSTAHLP
jgi:hypothetical protein